MKKVTILVLAFAALATGAIAQKTPVAATVNVQRILNEYTAFQTAVEKVRGSVAPVEEEMQRMQEGMQQLMKDIQDAQTASNNPAASEAAKAEAQQRIAELQEKGRGEQEKLAQFRQQAQQLAQQGQQTELAPLQQKALDAVKSVAQDKGIDIVLPLNGVVYADESMEITDAVIAVLNAEAE